MMLNNLTFMGLWLQRFGKICAALFKGYDKIYDPQYGNICLKTIKTITRHYITFWSWFFQF